MKRFFRKLLSGFAQPTGRRTHTLRDRKARLSLESLEDRRLMSTLVTSPNPQAPIIPNVQIETVFYGSAWTGQPSDPERVAELSTEARDLDQFFGNITNSQYMGGLSQYSMTTVYGTVIRPGLGSFVHTDFVPGLLPSVPGAPVPPVSEGTVQTMLANEIQSGRLDAPNGNTLYMVFMPPGVMAAADVGYTGHHSSFAYGSGTAYFATVEHPLTGVNPKGGIANPTNFQVLTEIASHEMVEAITDPMGNVPGQAAWGDRNSGDTTYRDEIGDIAQDVMPPGGTMGLEGLTGYGYVVQKYWSNQDNASVIPGGINFQAISVVPTLANLAFSLTDQTGRTIQGNWGSLTWQSSDLSQAAFSGTFDGQAVTVLVQTNGGQQLAVQISSASSVLFSGAMYQPSGGWVNRDSTGNFLAPDYVELDGVVIEGGQAAKAFGTGGAIYPPQYTGAGYGGSYGGMGTSPGDNYNNPLRFHRPNYM
jgi:hypothetical protein